MHATIYNGRHAIASDHRADTLWLKAAAERGDITGTYVEDDHFVGIIFNSKGAP